MSHRGRGWSRPGLLVALGALLLGLAPEARAQVGAEESAKKLKPAEGLEATLWASEPLVVNPTNMDVDSRGRVWVTEGLNYRLTRNRQFQRKDLADRIKVLEDTDGDGKADKVTVFADHIFPVPMGIAVEEKYDKDGKYTGCKVYVGNSPDLLVFEDTDGDDKADKRYPLLTGFGGIDSDHGVHGMVLGPDGKLYFTHGDGCCSVQQDHSERQQNFDVTDDSGRHVKSDQLAHTLRADRDGKNFEILCDRQRNNYETCINSFGNIFTSDNDDDGNRGCRVIWAMDGGHYGYKTSPRLHWGEEIPGNVPKLVGTGNGSPCGIMVYEGRALGKDYEGALFEAEAGTRQINFFPITRKGASFRTDYKVLLGSDDPWFRPVDVAAMPDGSLVVADWYDGGVGGHAFRDQTTGRIYRVARKGKKVDAETQDFATIKGLVSALRSPVVATRDAAQRGLIARDKEGVAALRELFEKGEPTDRARALWTLHAIEGDGVALAALKDDDPRIREQGVRILGRDVARNGVIEYKIEEVRNPPPALRHLDELLAMASDPDAGVRRELILALRNVDRSLPEPARGFPFDRINEALKTLTRMWDGQDRWYLEALGLALEKREGAFLKELFDGTLYGDLDLDRAGKESRVALPPYFPVDRNEAFLATGDELPPASALSKTLGLTWRLHRPEVLPLLTRILPTLESSELQQAADDALSRIDDPAGAAVLADLAGTLADPVRKRQVLDVLARKLGNGWRDARNDPRVARAIKSALNDDELRAQGVALAVATGEKKYADTLIQYADDAKAPDEVRVAAVEGLARLKPEGMRKAFDGILAAAGKAGTAPVAAAVVRAIPMTEANPDEALRKLIDDDDAPLGLRREALRTFASQRDGGRKLLAIVKAKKLPDELKTDATLALNSSMDRDVRLEAASLLPPPKSATGRPLPPIGALVRREGKAEDGRAVFFREKPNGRLDGSATVVCAGCHRVQGRGQWIGPDLSTIGTKYGKDELFNSILNPGAAIGYNFRTLVVATKDGRVLTGLPVEETPDRLVLKTSEGQRVAVPIAEVEERKYSEISLMPEGLAQTMSEQDLVDLVTFLSTLRQPVSIVGQCSAVGPLEERGDEPAFDVTAKVRTSEPLRGPGGEPLAWRRLTANAEGVVDPASLAGKDKSRAVYLFVPVNSPREQDARLVLDTRARVRAWLGGREIDLPDAKDGEPYAVTVTLPQGRSDLLIRVPGGADSAVVTTLVADKPLEFGEKP
ncbi:MAG TPA: PVC-type heme-binding CxxCH protein [Isosphaeraceae bacterium]|nr:PVC-type heme-binding CxxCH protein [Isosphaeraceae bacterium]